MRYPSRLASLIPVALAAGCTGWDPSAPAPGDDPARAPVAHLDATTLETGFHWLPPMVENPPPFVGSFDGARTPVIRVVCTGATGPACPVVVRFDEHSAGSTRVTVDLLEEAYKSNWHTPETLAVGSGLYRLEVLDGGSVLGQAPLRVVRTRQEANATAAGEIPLVRGQPFLIKFRIETRAFDQVPGPADASAVEAIPARAPVVRPDEYSATNPRLPGLRMSFTTALVVVAPHATVGELNAVLGDFGARILGGVPGVANAAPGTIVLRLPTATHDELNGQLDLLRQRPGILGAAADHEVATAAIPRANGGAPALYFWNVVAPAGSNWGLEAIRAPSFWNLNDAVAKAGTPPITMIYDAGFVPFHEDLAPVVNYDPAKVHDHGAHVAGIVGATFDNGLGIDGVNPFARLALRPLPALSFATVLVDFCTFIQTPSAPAVVNVSIGYGWGRIGVDPTVNQPAQQQATDDGLTVRACLHTAQLAGAQLPIVTAAAGNDASDGTWGSPFTAAALIHQAAPIIVVEALELVGGAVGRARSFSNINGHLSAPGAAIISTIAPSNGYGSLSGTSMAAPHVAGVAGYLLSLAPSFRPTMTTNRIRDLLVSTGTPVDLVAAPAMDAFAAALELDRLRNNTAVLQALVDVDDGSIDGNRRLSSQGTPVAAEDADGDGGPGDGTVDMADFRRWRDWLLQAENPTGLTLDGAADHPKKDLNRDAVIGTPAEENVHPRGDFNGDGMISRTATRAVSGSFGGQPATDLDLLRRVFSDPIYDEIELPVLLSSGDVAIDAGSCLDLPGAVAVLVAIQRNADTAQTIREERFDAAHRQIVLTVPADPDGYGIRVAALDATDQVLATSATTDSVVTLGGDLHYETNCASAISITPATVTLTPGQSRQFTATVTGSSNAAVTWSATGGTITSGGMYTAGTSVGSYTVTATSVASPALRATATVTINVASPSVSINFPGGGPYQAVVGVPYLLALEATGGDGTYHWSIASGALPGGLVLGGSGATAAIVGTPTGSPSSGQAIVQVQSGTSMAQVVVSIGVQLDPWLGGYEGTVVTPTGSYLMYALIYGYNFGSYTLATNWRSTGNCFSLPASPTDLTIQAPCGGNGSMITFTWGVATVNGRPRRQLTGTCTNCAALPVGSGGTPATFGFVLTER